jgi:hypothetical protein
MAAKKNLNNPNKPTTKVRSTKGPAIYGGKSTKLVDDKKGNVTLSNGKKGSGTSSYSKALGSTKSTALRDTKKLIKKGNTANADYANRTKKGTKLETSKFIREENRSAKKGK